MNQFREGKIA